MDIHEYQAKELLAGFGVAVPKGGVVYTLIRRCTEPRRSVAADGS